jgi:flagellar motor switch protein FliG
MTLPQSQPRNAVPRRRVNAAGAHRAAALLLALDEPAAARLAAALDAGELAALTGAMKTLEPLNAADLEALIDRFANETAIRISV